jgi:hypothetical protein
MKLKYKFNDFINKETLNTEYKKFTLNMSSLPIDLKLAEYYCTTYKFEFNNYIVQNIFKYFECFLLKYVCAFINSNINGKFYIGVNDLGFIEGIPFIGLLPKKQIKNKMYKMLLNKIIFKNNYNFNKFIKIKFIKIASPKKPENLIHPEYTQYLKKKEENAEIYNKYLNDISIWRHKHKFYTQKLVDLINNTNSRILIKDYIKKKDPNNNLIKLLDTDFKLEYKTNAEIINLKKKPDNIYYWVTKWKDEMCNKLKQTKPIYNTDNNFKSIPFNLIISVSNMIPYWIHNNDNITLTLIIIEIKSKSLNLQCKYYDYYYKKWMSCIRGISQLGEPEIQNRY